MTTIKNLYDIQRTLKFLLQLNLSSFKALSERDKLILIQY